MSATDTLLLLSALSNGKEATKKDFDPISGYNKVEKLLRKLKEAEKGKEKKDEKKGWKIEDRFVLGILMAFAGPIVGFCTFDVFVHIMADIIQTWTSAIVH